jgi:hypothetical protein
VVVNGVVGGEDVFGIIVAAVAGVALVVLLWHWGGDRMGVEIAAYALVMFAVLAVAALAVLGAWPR